MKTLTHSLRIVNKSKTMHAQFVLMLITTLLFASCSSKQRTVSINSVRPSELSFAPDIRNLVIIDRTKFDKNKNPLNVIEGVLTGEMPEEDKAAVQALMNSMSNRLRESPRFDDIKIAPVRYEGNSLTSAFPNPLSAGTLKVIAGMNNADMIISVEMFDTDFIITDGVRSITKTVKTESGSREVQEDEFYANGVGNITLGIRIYDAKTYTVLDEKLLKRSNTWNSKGRSKADVLGTLISKSDANRNLSQQAGFHYANRLAPMNVRLVRSFRGKHRKVPAIEQGSRYADVADWENAIKTWKSGLPSAPTKQAGYLTHNIAIGYEILGNMDEAIEWAQKSYVQYGNKDAKGYYNAIRNRLSNERLAEEQLQ